MTKETTAKKAGIQNRYDFVLLFDVKDGNPNGDPDAGNLPRVDPETGNGLVTDVCLKRKVRNYIGLVKDDKAPYEIFVKEKAVLNQLIERAYDEDKEVQNLVEAWLAWKKDKKKPKPAKHYEDAAKDWMCKTFFDIRAFGAVMSTGDKKEGGEEESATSKIKKTAGQVRGPIQLTFSRSVDQVVSLEHSITRMAVTNERDLDKERTMGRKYTVPYALYRCHGFISAPLAEQCAFSQADLDLFWKALKDMFEHDRSAARGQMATRKLIVFRHESRLGNAPADKLFERVKVQRKDQTKPARGIEDYEVKVDKSNLPAGVSLEEMV